ncbi:hypothetical protein FGG08_004735 [Glutinoglossum americanum]|uniref:WD40 repeat-like protein n=1 Tax=Glutinoglossum americanum TaxID=1670608 RepID=A0A9P8IAR1_9PEZI|nr:hypothetical protein FGG08_004735 [Glutinoglossum americanum]
MRYTLEDRLFKRELGESSRYSSLQGLYGDRHWIDEMDIVNELGGHSGCVNALSWSRSGRLLASGSDDLHLNIHQYLPESSTAPFALSTTVSTGHTANIFSVKFMPHSNDRTIVTAAGDAEVRVFDIEYSGRSVPASTPATLASSGRSRGFNNIFNGVRYLSDGDTNARIYKSHSDRVKRIVTENSPYLFLTCSEDGEVRQWDTRQPSSFYPASRSARGLFSRGAVDCDNSSVPPPLISYKRYRLEMNTISCSPNQPHYIALGGSHLHCFLHDRRMTGRDILVERGEPSSPSSPGSLSGRENDSLNTATRCVRKFAPNGVKKMRRMDTGHITACKISDANPNEMVVSWSGDWIYSFDLLRSPGTDDPDAGPSETVKKGKGKGKAKESADRKDRKRKRGQLDSSSSIEGQQRRGSKQKEGSPEESGDGELALRVRYENGQSEEIRIQPSPPLDPAPIISQAREAILSEPQKKSHRIAEAVVNLRKELFGLMSSKNSPSSLESTPHATSFTAALGLAAANLPIMDEIVRTWRYPVNPPEEEVVFQVTLRGNRESARRFVQAAGWLVGVLGAEPQTTSDGKSATLEQFKRISPAPREENFSDHSVQFCYEFLRAILLWLEGGLDALCQGFKPLPEFRRYSSRFPIQPGAGLEAIDEVLIPYLLQLAGSRSIPNVDASKFERDEHHVTFGTETAAVTAFSNAIKIPFGQRPNETGMEESGSGTENAMTQDKGAALRFWGLKVGRGVLMNAGEGINYSFVDRAFGGLGTSGVEDEAVREEINLDDDEDDDVVEDVDIVRRERAEPSSSSSPATASRRANNPESGRGDSPPPYSSRSASIEEDSLSEDEIILDLRGEFAVNFGSRSGDDDNDEDADSDEEDSEDEEFGGRLMWASAFDNSGRRAKVGRDIPCSSHTRQYRGHCNVKTVKDVNFFGLEDEYVVSGSDSGHVFIWDKRTSQLVNILEGDGEVVNVVQDAQNGINIAHQGSSGWSSLQYDTIRSHGRLRRRGGQTPATTGGNPDEGNTEPHGLTSCKRMNQSYAITSQNDVERQGGMRDAFLTVQTLSHARVGVDFAVWLGWFL